MPTVDRYNFSVPPPLVQYGGRDYTTSFGAAAMPSVPPAGGGTLFTVSDTAFVIKTTSQTGLILLTANWNSQSVVSSLLPARIVEILTGNLQRMMAQVPNLSAFESGFSGLVRALIGVKLFETSASFGVWVDYTSPTATLFVSGLLSTSHVGVTVPHSVVGPVNLEAQ